MTDKEIVDLFWARSESAIPETDAKYGKYCHYIAYRILGDGEDAKEITYAVLTPEGAAFVPSDDEE